MPVLGLDHIQIAIPAGGEAQARLFYGVTLGMSELPKPPHLAARGGAWYQCGDLQLHLGVDRDFRPATKGHPGLLVDSVDNISARLATAGFTLKSDEPIEGFARIFTSDPFGNRIELLERLPALNATRQQT